MSEFNLNFDDLNEIKADADKKEKKAAKKGKEEGYSTNVRGQFSEKDFEMTPVMQGRRVIGELYKDTKGIVRMEKVIHKNGTYKMITYNEAQEVLKEEHFKKDGSPAKKVGARKTLTVEKKLYGFYGNVKLDSVLDDVSMNNEMTKSDLIHKAILGSLPAEVRTELDNELKKANLKK